MASYQLGGKRAPAVHIWGMRLDDVFSVFYKYYDDHALGEAVIENREASALTDVKATLLIRQYMDAPKDCAVADFIKPGDTQKIDLYGLFKDTVLNITEATKVPVEITVEYSLKGEKRSQTEVMTLKILDRNAMTWDDDRRAAAFVTVKDPQILSFAKNVLAATDQIVGAGVDRRLLIGMALHDALAIYGLAYSQDPARSYSVTSLNKTAVDFLQFPRQTLEYRAGDCDDLSILYCALLESLNVDTAFITVPGHIYMAFALETEDSDARKSFLHPEDLIFKAGRAWVPVEITQTRASFLDAWATAAQEWRENDAKGQANFYPLADAWKAFEPVGLPGTPAAISQPAESAVVSRYKDEVSGFVDREIGPRVADLKAALAKQSGSSKTMNKLGVLYARYGQLDQAERQFQAIVAKEEYLPALINLGNLANLRGDSAGGESFTCVGKAAPPMPTMPASLMAATMAAGDRVRQSRAWSWPGSH